MKGMRLSHMLTGVPVIIVPDVVLPTGVLAQYVPELGRIFASSAGYEALKARIPEERAKSEGET